MKPPLRNRLQTVIIKKSVASTREQAKKLVREMGYRTYTSRSTANSWRFRQRPPECFVGGYWSKCFTKDGVEKGICLVYAKPDPKARRRSCR